MHEIAEPRPGTRIPNISSRLPPFNPRRLRDGIILLLGVAVLLVAARLWSYLLFHTLAELYSVCIAATYFVIAWHTRKINQNPSIAALGITYLFVAILDIFHTLAYAGMDVFVGYNYAANQVWVLARFLEAAGLFYFSLDRRLDDRGMLTYLGVNLAYTALGLASIFLFRIFPACYIKELGQTDFKIAAEVAIMVLLAISSLSFRSRRPAFPAEVYANLQASIWLTVLSELSFTLYLSNYDWVNMTGHFFKIVSFYLIYRAIIVTGLEKPQELLYARLSEKNIELERSNKTKDTFISILSHDLRSPLSGIQSAADYLVENRGTLAPETERELLRELAASAGLTRDLVENVLTWARCQAGALKPELAPFDAAEVFRSQVRLLAEAARRKNLDVAMVIPDGVPMTSDVNMLSTILRNLIQNAIKFSHPGGRIEAKLVSDGKHRIFEVADQGVGMSPETLAQLFRIDSRRRNLGTAGETGAGFGLILSREFATALEGSLVAASQLGAGSTFRLEVPTQPTADSTAPA